MFVINEDKSIYITRGDVAFFSIVSKTDTGETYKFQAGDVVRFKVFEKKACENVVLSKDFGIEAETEEVEIYLEESDTKIGEVISKPVDYWYEVELNPYTDPQTIIGYDDDGAKVFKLFPEGNEKEDDEPITPEDIPVVDVELDLTSTRPVQNQAISRAILKISDDMRREIEGHTEAIDDFRKEIDDIKEEMGEGSTVVSNKPYGTYTGNGTTDLTVDVGSTDGKAVLVWAFGGNGLYGMIVTRYGAFGVATVYPDMVGTPKAFSPNEALFNFAEGRIVIRTSDEALNRAGDVYEYQVL